jgi:Arc/MetJ family transcription regulator
MDMPTNLAIDDDLLQRAQEAGGFKTKRETVNEALRWFIQRKARMKLIESFGTFDLAPYEEIKAARTRGIHVVKNKKTKKKKK